MAKKPIEIEALAHKAAKRSGATATLTRNWPGRPLHYAAAEFTAVSEIEAEFSTLIEGLPHPSLRAAGEAIHGGAK